MDSLVLRLFFAVVWCGSAVLKAEAARRFSYPTEPASLMSTEWQRDFVREPIPYDLSKMPSRKIFCSAVLGRVHSLDLRYVQNHSEAQMNFYDWYLGDSSVSYSEALRRQHIESALGPPGEKRTYVHLTEHSAYTSEEIEPGVYRVELLARNQIHYGVDSFDTEPEQWERLRRHGLKQEEIEVKTGYRLRAREIPENLQTALEKSGRRVIRVAPKGEAETTYQMAAANRMIDLKNWRNQSPMELRGNLDAFLNDLSDYYHTAIHWMPFSAINNSILMGQVNVLLRHFGLKTISHNGLDYLALMSHYDLFRGVFKEAVLRENGDGNPPPL